MALLPPAFGETGHDEELLKHTHKYTPHANQEVPCSSVVWRVSARLPKVFG